MHEKIVILDFGSQYTQLIARRIREAGVYSEILPYNKKFEITKNIKGVILSGSPFSVRAKNALKPLFTDYLDKVPTLAICYGAQWVVDNFGGKVESSQKREYGRANLKILKKEHPLFKSIPAESQVWMSHADSIMELPEGFNIIAQTNDIPVAAFEREINGTDEKALLGVQFHPEVVHTVYGAEILSNFLFSVCACKGDWTPEVFIEEAIEKIRKTTNGRKVLIGLSGGVDSSVAAILIHRAIGKNLHCVFVNNGLLRKNEFSEVLESYKDMGLNITGVDASKKFYEELKGVDDPEKKRKIIGRVFIEVFDEEAHKIEEVDWLAQGTIYPDVIESVSVHGPSVTIKSHHNVGGLPEKLNMKVLEPLRALFKDEVRKIGYELEISPSILERHPFPGPGLGIRIIGDITEEKVRILQEADYIFVNSLKERKLYNDVWQAGAMLLPVKSVGVMGDERTYENVVALRAVSSVDGMTADWCHLPYDFLAEVSQKIINQVKGINRVVYDISSKPPSTIEWE